MVTPAAPVRPGALRGVVELPAAVRARVHEASGLRLDEVVPIAPAGVPKTTSGKPRRAEARKRWLDGRIADLRKIQA